MAKDTRQSKDEAPVAATDAAVWEPAAETPPVAAEPATPIVAGPLRYRVTAKAGPFVAGRRPDKDGTLTLTHRQARYPLLNGEIETV